MERFSQSATDPAFVQDPYPFYDRLRAAGDIVFWEDYGMPMATTHAAVSALMKDRRLGRARPDFTWDIDDEVLGAFNALEAHSLLELEPPDHTRLRALVNRAFTSRSVQSLAPAISAIADTLLVDLPAQPFDLLDAYCRPLPVLVIARMLGVPSEMAPDLLKWSNAMVAMYQARTSPEIDAAAGQAAADFTAYLEQFIEGRRKAPGSDLMTALIAAEQDGTRLSTPELIATCILLLNAGHEATVHTLGNGVKAILESNMARDMLLPEQVNQTVEEVLRFDPPLHMFTRHVYEEVEFFGHTFKPGDEVGCLLASANRDDAAWPAAHRFDPSRAIKTNLSFGAGIHFCVGAPLARLEMQIALPLLFSGCPELQLVEPPKYADIYHFHGLQALSVSV